MRPLTVAIICLLCFPNLLQGQEHMGGGNGQEHNGGHPQGGNGQPNEGHPQGGNGQPHKPEGQKEPNWEKDQANDNKDGPTEFCFANSTKEVKRILNICKCEVYERFKTFCGPDLSGLFQGVAAAFKFQPQKVEKGQKKKPCNLDPGYMERNPIGFLLYNVKRYGFFQVKTCFWERLKLIVDGEAKWENLIEVLKYFHMEDEKKQNITDIIKNCEEISTEDEEGEDDEGGEEEEEELKFEPKDLQDTKFLDKLKKKIEDAVEKSKRGGMNKADYKIGKCIKEQLDTICKDFQTVQRPSYDPQQGHYNQQHGGGQGGGGQNHGGGGGGGGGHG